MTGRRSTVLKRVGISLIAIGSLLLAFVAYQLWGTALSFDQAQAQLRHELEAQLHRQAARPTPGATTSTTVPGSSGGSDNATLPAPAPIEDAPPLGAPLGFMTIPRIGMDRDVIIEGVGTEQLRQGPGHYPGTPLPGEPGNAAIAGHRTTYAAPFYNLNELVVGDPITIQTLQGTFVYGVTRSAVVDPTDTAVLQSTSTQPELTLTTCNPRYSASQRLVVTAVLTASHPLSSTSGGHPSRPTDRLAPSSGAALAGSSEGGSIGAALLWGLLTAGVAIEACVVWRLGRRWTRGAAAVLGGAGFLLALFVFFGYVSAALPASF